VRVDFSQKICNGVYHYEVGVGGTSLNTVSQKGATFIFAITLATVDQF